MLTPVLNDGRGGKQKVSEKKEYTDDVTLYNPSTNVMKSLAPLPYGLSDVAVVARKENIIIKNQVTMFLCVTSLNDIVRSCQTCWKKGKTICFIRYKFHF